MTDIQKKAYKDYVNGMKYGDIAAKYKLPIGTVKTWANRYFKKSQVSDESVETPKNETMKPSTRKKGGSNNVKHGAYKKVSWDILEDDELELIEAIDYSPEEIMRNNYKNLLLRERRLLKLIKQHKQESEGNRSLILGSVTKIHSSSIDGIEDKTITVAESVFNALKVYEAELTKIEAQKTKVAVELKKMEIERKNSQSTDNSKINELKKIFSPDEPLKDNDNVK